MLKVNCEACGAPYEVDPRRIPASGLKMRCPGCGASFHVRAPDSSDARSCDADLPAAQVPPRANAAARSAGRPIAPAFAGSAAPNLVDLPKPKRRTTESLPENLADD